MAVAIMLTPAEYRALTEQRVCVQNGCKTVPEKGIRCAVHAARHARYQRERLARLAAADRSEPAATDAPAPPAEGT